MNKKQHRNPVRTIGLGLLLILFVSGCANLRQGVAWPALSTVTYNGETVLAVVYEGRIELLDPADGNVVNLVDSEGQARVDEQGNPREWVVEGGQFENAQFYTNPINATDGGDDTFILPTYDNRILEFYADTARIVNPAGIAIDDGLIANPVLTDAFIYLPYRSEDLVALDRSSLDIAWTLDTQGGVWAEPLLHDGVLYVASMDHFLYALDAETGEPVWSTPADLGGAIASTPVLYDDHLYVGSYSHKMFMISLDGEIVAEHEGQNWIWGTPVIRDGLLHYADLSGNVYALDASNLNEVWSAQPSTSGIRPAPLVTEEYVIVASRSGRIYWVERETSSGAERRIFEAEVEGTPEILSDLLYIAGDEIGIDYDLIIVGTIDPGKLVVGYPADPQSNRLPWVHNR